MLYTVQINDSINSLGMARDQEAEAVHDKRSYAQCTAWNADGDESSAPPSGVLRAI